MNYNNQYKNLIKTRKLLIRDKNDRVYEEHHILPKSLGGSNERENLILLTPKEHYIAHLLLTMMYKGKEKAKMCYAFMAMCMNNGNQNRKISSRQYEFAKKLVSENCKGENAAFYGKKLSEEAKKAIRERMKGDNNPSRKYGPWNKGKKLPKHSEETKKKMSKSHKGKKHSEEAKKNMSKAMSGKRKSEEHKKKISESLKGRKIPKEIVKKTADKLRGRKYETTKCPHCGKEGGYSAMKRWHFDRCKQKN